MKTRAKDLGTRLETRIVNTAQKAGLIAERLAEGGAYDKGDIRIYSDRELVGEVKDRMSLNLPATLEKAILKSGSRDAFVVWRKMKRTSGAYRVQDGPIVVAVTLDRYIELLLREVS